MNTENEDDNEDTLPPEKMKQFKTNLAAMSAFASQKRALALMKFEEAGEEGIEKLITEIKALQNTPEKSLANVIGLLADIGFCAVFLDRYENSSELE